MSYLDDEIGGYANDEGCYTCGSRRHDHLHCDYEPALIGPPTFETYMELRVKLEETLRKNQERLAAFKATPKQRAIQADIDRQVAMIEARRRARRETHPLPAWQLPEEV